ncbi:MAG: hypothetical protein HYU77_11150 [Betaproteobacteria bacterium]|nr:hypothetical protein [Betaproteobacteria bacterium]
MKKHLLAAAVLSTLAAPATVLAQESPHTFTGNVGIYSQYIFRGLTQTNEDPALQGGLDYSHSSGFYAGAWGSNISWLKENTTSATAPVASGTYNTGGSLELDVYAGFKGAIGKTDFGYDVGVLYYWYPGDTQAPGFAGLPYHIKADTTEIYGALSWKWITAKLSYSLGDTFGVDDAKGTYYFDLGATVPIGETGLTFGAHYGIFKFDGTDPRNYLTAAGVAASNDELFSYDDFRLSLAYDLGKASKVLTGAEIGVMYSGTSGAHSCGYGAFTQAATVGGAACTGVFPKDIADDQFTVWLKKTF